MPDPTKYTITWQGQRWIASDGSRHAEGDDPAEAIMAMTDPDVVEAGRIGNVKTSIGNFAATLISLVAIDAPDFIIRNHMQVLNKMVERLLTTRDSSKDDGADQESDD